MLPGEHQQVLSNLQSHFDEFLEDSEESEVFTVADCTQLERDVVACKEYYQELLRSAERGKAQISFLQLQGVASSHGNTHTGPVSSLSPCINAFWNFCALCIKRWVTVL